jgi:hypothetical protein
MKPSGFGVLRCQEIAQPCIPPGGYRRSLQREARVARVFINASSQGGGVWGGGRMPSMSRRSFDPVLLESLRSMPVTEALNRLGLHWKTDPDFRPRKN